jgi:hypothetical protein
VGRGASADMAEEEPSTERRAVEETRTGKRNWVGPPTTAPIREENREESEGLCDPRVWIAFVCVLVARGRGSRILLQG